MLRINRLVIISLLIFTQIALWGQNNTNSPYTRFGYGGLADRAMGSGKAMGGIGIGLRSKKPHEPGFLQLHGFDDIYIRFWRFRPSLLV